MIHIGPSNTFKKWVFGLTGLFAIGTGAVGSAGLLLYLMGAASPEVLTVNPYSDASAASTFVSAICASIGTIALTTSFWDVQSFRKTTWILSAMALCGAAGFFMLGYIAWPIAIVIAVSINMYTSYSVRR